MSYYTNNQYGFVMLNVNDNLSTEYGKIDYQENIITEYFKEYQDIIKTFQDIIQKKYGNQWCIKYKKKNHKAILTYDNKEMYTIDINLFSSSNNLDISQDVLISIETYIKFINDKELKNKIRKNVNIALLHLHDKDSFIRIYAKEVIRKFNKYKTK